MRYITILSAFFLLFAVEMLVPVKQAAASQSSDFVDWALNQGKICDQAWDKIAVGKKAGTTSSSGDTTRSRSVSSIGSHTRIQMKSGEPWIHSKSGYIHKSKPSFMPLSTRERKGPTRGTGALRNPARARLSLSHKFRRIPNPRLSEKHFFESRSGNWRIRLNSANRTGKTWRSRGGAARPAFRVDRPKRTRR